MRVYMNDRVLIYHNPDCGTSRNVLALIRNSGVEPEIIEYLKKPPSREVLVRLLADAQLTARQVLRTNVAEYEDLDLGDVVMDESMLIDCMLKQPILINRPFVVTAKGTRLCRPSEIVLEILVNPQQAPFYKEDGEQVV